MADHAAPSRRVSAYPLLQLVFLILQRGFEFLRLVEEQLLVLIRADQHLVQLLILDFVELHSGTATANNKRTGKRGEVERSLARCDHFASVCCLHTRSRCASAPLLGVALVSDCAVLSFPARMSPSRNVYAGLLLMSFTRLSKPDAGTTQQHSRARRTQATEERSQHTNEERATRTAQPQASAAATHRS